MTGSGGSEAVAVGGVGGGDVSTGGGTSGIDGSGDRW